MCNALVLLAPGFEEIEAVTIIDLLRRASVEVLIAGLTEDMVTGSHAITIKTDAYYRNVDPNNYDVFILPGGQPGTNNLKTDKTVLSWISERHKSGKLLAAICAAPTVLHAAGITAGFRLTSYPSEKGVFDPDYYSEAPVVHDRNLITSRGVGTAIDFSLALISLLKDDQTAGELRKRILYKHDQ